MKKMIIFLLINVSFQDQTITAQEDWKNNDYIYGLISSPYHEDGLPNTLLAFSNQLETFKFFIGNNGFGIISLNLSTEDYFQLLKKSLATGLVKATEQNNKNLELLNDFFEQAPELLKQGSGSLDEISKKLRKFQMASVRKRDGSKAKLYYSMFKRINTLKEYSTKFENVLKNASDLKQGVEICMIAAEPISCYKNSEFQLRTFLKYGQNLPHELKEAIIDCINLINNERDNFISNILLNLRNNKREILNVALQLGSKIVDENQEKIKQLAIKYFGSKNVTFISDILYARQITYNIGNKLLNLDEMSRLMPTCYVSSVAENYLHSCCFTKVKIEGTKEEYIASIALLLLVEANLQSSCSDLLNAASKIQDNSKLVKDLQDNTKKCITGSHILQDTFFE